MRFADPPTLNQDQWDVNVNNNGVLSLITTKPNLPNNSPEISEGSRVEYLSCTGISSISSTESDTPDVSGDLYSLSDFSDSRLASEDISMDSVNTEEMNGPTILEDWMTKLVDVLQGTDNYEDISAVNFDQEQEEVIFVIFDSLCDSGINR